MEFINNFRHGHPILRVRTYGGYPFQKGHALFVRDVLNTQLTFKKSLKIPKGDNQNPYIEEEQTTQWPKEKAQKDKQRSTKHTYKTKDRVTRTHVLRKNRL